MLNNMTPAAAALLVANPAPADAAPTSSTTTPAAPVEAAPAAPIDDNKVAAAMARIARQESKFREEQQKFKADLDKWNQERQTIDQELNQYRQRETKIKSKDYSALKELGFDYNDYTKFLLNNEQPTTETLMEKRLAEMEQKFEQKLTAKQQEDVQQRQAAYAEQQEQLKGKFKQEIGAYLEQDFSSSEPKYEFLSIQEDPGQLIYGIIEEHYNQTSERGQARILSKEEAAEIAEKYLEDEAEKRFFNLRKVRSKMNQGAEPPAPQSSGGFRPPQTLTNDTRPQQTPTKSGFSVDDSLAEATKMLKWVQK